MEFLNVKALHIIFVVSWFAALFYIPRIFIYYAEAEQKKEPARSILQTQYNLMAKRLWYIIGWPSCILAVGFGIYMLILTPAYLSMGWMHVKLSFVFGLMFYHFGCHRIFQQQQKGIVKYSAFKLRIFNEAATLLLFAIVFVVVLQNSINWIWGFIGLILFAVLMMLAIRMYKRIRQKKSWDKFEEDYLKEEKK